jgi:hypothetical protein
MNWRNFLRSENDTVQTKTVVLHFTNAVMFNDVAVVHQGFAALGYQVGDTLISPVSCATETSPSPGHRPNADTGN